MKRGNRDNRLKMDVYGSKVWRPVVFHDGKNPDGSFRGSRGFKNLLTDQEVSGSEPPYVTGEALGMRVSDAYRDGYEGIRWESASPQSGS